MMDRLILKRPVGYNCHKRRSQVIGSARPVMYKIRLRKADIEGFNIFYRKAGPTDAQTLLLLHGFPKMAPL
jgi:hypothetical protein